MPSIGVVPAPSRIKDLANRTFGRITVLGFSRFQLKPSGQKRNMWLCQCSCGTRKEISSNALLNGGTESCGCKWKDGVGTHNLKHGCSKKGKWSGSYKTHAGMLQRCLNKNCARYPDYGGRGIVICDRWLHGEDGKSGFECFVSDMGERPEGMTIERIDNDGDYSKENCKWETRRAQSHNKRTSRLLTAFGETKCLGVWSKERSIDWGTLRMRLGLGWNPEDALTLEVNKSRKEHKCRRSPAS